MDKLFSYILNRTKEGKITKEDGVQMVTMLRQIQNRLPAPIEEDMAIIGMSLQLADIDSVDEFWVDVEAGADLTGRFPAEREQGIKEYLTSKLEGSGWDLKYLPGSYISNIDSFDYDFFRITPKEAELMDPSQRVFLQTAWKAIEDAGYGGNKLRGSKTGLFVGYSGNTNYHTMILDTVPEMAPAALTGNIAAMLPSRIAYLLDLKGPTMILDTACSSSLYAIHLACKAIHNGDCEMAIAGGVRINLLPVDNSALQLGVEAMDGRTRTFDAEAEGAGWGEGTAALLLKPLSKAREDNDPIYAVIKGSAVNQDGASIGITAPNSSAQAEVLVNAWKNANINPETLSYIEVHGTATKLGDPLEIEGLHRAFKQFTHKQQFCAVSTIKTNTGHLYECAGIAGVIRAVMAMKNKTIPASINFNQPNKTINFMESPVYVNTKSRYWEAHELPRRCGVSSFGLSGTNCHLVLEEYISETNAGDDGNSDTPDVIVLSAKSYDALDQLLCEYDRNFEKIIQHPIRDVCYTANTGRGHYSHRLAILFHSIEDLQKKIRMLISEGPENALHPEFIYGIHKVVSGNKKQLQEHEIKESLRAQFSESANQELKNLHETTSIDPEQLIKVCKLYTQGALVDWSLLYTGEKRKKVNLPAYRFDKNRCWIQPPLGLTARDHSLHNLYYKMEWRKDQRKPKDSDNRGTVLIFNDNLGKGRSIIEALHSLQRNIIVVDISDRPGCSINDLNHFTIDGSKQSYFDLMMNLKNVGVNQIIHLWALNQSPKADSVEELRNIQKLGIYSLFYLTKAIAHAEILHDIDWVTVLSNCMEVTGGESEINPDHSPVYGIGKVISKEHPNLKCRIIDVDCSTEDRTFIQEVSSPSDHYAVALRMNERYTEVFSEVTDLELKRRTAEIREDGVYLITGGLGGIGLEIAKYLANNKKINLILLGRTNIPPREDWKDILSDRAARKEQKRIRALKELEEMKANVECISADISNQKEMERVYHYLKKKYGEINGIVHAAGVSSDGPIADRGDEMFETIFSPKVYGTWLLDYLTREDDIDFMILFSSVATLFSAFGQSDYVAANAYLDAFSAHRQKQSKRTLTINWSTWKETGMAHESGHAMDTIFKAMSTAQAIKGFDVLLHSNVKRALIGEINYQGSGALLLERSGVPCSESIMQSINNRKIKQKKSHPSKHKNYDALVNEIILHGRSDGAYTQLEKTVAACCKSAFGYTEFDIYDNFFEMGADSLMLMRLQSEVEVQTSTRLTLGDLFEHTSIYQLSKFIEPQTTDQSSNSMKYPKLEAIADKAWYPASFAQKRMFLAQRRQPESVSYNQYRVTLMETRIEAERMELAARKMIRRHEILRTALINKDGDIVQYIHDDIDFKLDFWEADESSAQEIIQNFRRAFDFTAPPLFRLGLIKVKENRFYLLYDAHHIITDGVSMELFMRELFDLYMGKSIAEPLYQYKDYVDWQQRCLKAEFIQQQKAYWENTLNTMDVLEMPTDYPRKEYFYFEGGTISLVLDHALSAKLSGQVKSTGTTMYIFLLSAFSILLSKYSANEDIVIGSPVTGRPIRELDRILGIFINMLAIRIQPKKDTTFRDYLGQVKKVVLDSFDNQDYPLDELMDSMQMKRSMNRHPLFDTIFVFQNTYEESTDNLLLQPHEEIYNLSDYDLTLEALERNECIHLKLEYSTVLFKKETSIRMLDDYHGILITLSENMDMQLQDIELSSFRSTDVEHESVETITFDFNF